MIKVRRIFLKTCLCLIALVILAAIYAWGIYNGYWHLNNPSKSAYPVRGVDVSHYQGDIDWEVLATEDIDFAYMKATEGSSHVDDKFTYNWEQAARTSLAVGAYHFFSFDSPGENQAAHFIRTIGQPESMLPPVVDVEYYADKKVNQPDPDAVRQELRIFLDVIKAQYQTVPVIYSTEEVWEKYLQGYFTEEPLWIRNVYTKPMKEADWTFWQYSNRTRLKGYQGEEEYIDMNVFRGDEKDWEAWKG